MVKSIYTGLIAESQKSKGTFISWFTLIGSVLIPLITFLIYFFRYEYFLPADGVNPWINYMMSNVKTVSSMLFPLFIILSIALNINAEHKENSWKKLFVLPVRRESIYLSKLAFLFVQVTVSIILFSLSVILLGFILGFLHEELKLLEYSPVIYPFVKLLFRLVISVLGILSIQFCLSLFFRNIIVPISIGIFFIIVSNIIGRNWDYSAYFPYASPIRLFYDLNGVITPDIYFGLRLSEITSLVTFICVSVLGVILFNTKKIN